jgi:hypothetical protein
MKIMSDFPLKIALRYSVHRFHFNLLTCAEIKVAGF